MPEWPREIREEVRQHLDDQYDALRAAGASHEEAMQAMAEDVAAVMRGPLRISPDQLKADVRYAVRVLRKHPAFTCVVVLTLALGIGANAAIFSVVNAIVLRPLPYRDADRIVTIRGDLHRPGLDEIPTSAGEYVDYRNRARAFDYVAAYDTLGFNLTGGGDPERVEGAIVTPSLFPLLGAPASLGRTFQPDEEQPGRGGVVILSHALWARRFGSDRAIVGRPITIDGQPAQVVGVMPAGFEFPDASVEMWRPIVLDADAVSENNRGSHGFTVLAKVKNGVALDQARADLASVTATFKAEHPNNYINGFSAKVRPLRDEIVGDTSRALFILLGAVALVLLIACANVANLLLARAASRRREIALRTALGASRGRVVRQLLTESVIIAALGGAFGLALASWGVDVLVAAGPDSIPRLREATVDGRVMMFTSVASLVTGLLFGIAPAKRATRTPLNETLKEGRRSGDTAAHGRAAKLLVIAEVALSLVLLVAAGLLIHSFARLQDVKPGFDADNLLTLRIALPESRYPTFQKGDAFFDEVFERLRASGADIGGVAATNAMPFSGTGGSRSFYIEGRVETGRDDRLEEQLRIVSAGYFETMRIPLMRGREFSRRDKPASPRVAVVNEAFARKHWPNGNPLGHRVAFTRDDPAWYEIVGVAGNVKHRGLDAADRPELYVPYSQPLFASWTVRPMYVIVRTGGDPLSAGTTVRNAVAAIDRDQPISDVKTMNARIDRSLTARRFNMALLAAFALLALTLAAVGIYGLVACSVTERTHEIGVRLALGAQRRDVMSMIVAQGMTTAAIGALVGIAAALAVMRVMSSLLFGVTASDPPTFAAITVVLLAAAFAACYIPARRATRLDPLTVLRIADCGFIDD